MKLLGKCRSHQSSPLSANPENQPHKHSQKHNESDAAFSPANSLDKQKLAQVFGGCGENIINPAEQSPDVDEENYDTPVALFSGDGIHPK